MSITAQIEAAGNEKYVHVEKLENKKKNTLTWYSHMNNNNDMNI